MQAYQIKKIYIYSSHFDDKIEKIGHISSTDSYRLTTEWSNLSISLRRKKKVDTYNFLQAIKNFTRSFDSEHIEF